MNDKEAWDIYFASVCAMRFHPRNVPTRETLDEDQLHEIHLAAAIADEMLNIRTKRWQYTRPQ